MTLNEKIHEMLKAKGVTGLNALGCIGRVMALMKKDHCKPDADRANVAAEMEKKYKKGKITDEYVQNKVNEALG